MGKHRDLSLETHYVYLTTNNITGHIYVGCTFKRVQSYLGGGKDLHKAFNTYGKENFSKEILRVCKNKKFGHLFEMYFIKLYDSTNPVIGYNKAPGGSTPSSIRKEDIQQSSLKKSLTYKAKTSEELLKINSVISNSLKQTFSAKTQEQKRIVKLNISKGHINRTEEQKLATSKKLSEAYAKMSYERKAEIMSRRLETRKKNKLRKRILEQHV